MNITEEDIKAYIEKYRKNGCSVCNHDKFIFPGPESPEVACPPLYTNEQIEEKDASTTFVLPCFYYLCANCGHVYFIIRNHVLEWKKTT